MKRYLVILMACLLSLTIAAWAAGDKKDRPHPKDRMKACQKLQNALKLTDQQIKELQNKSFAYRKEMIKDKANLELAVLELRQLKAQAPVDMKKLEAKIHEIANMKANMEIQKMRNIEDAKTVLTESQKETLKKLKKHPGMLRPITEENSHREETALSEDAPEAPENEAILNDSGDIEEISFIEEVFDMDLSE